MSLNSLELVASLQLLPLPVFNFMF